MSSDRISDGIGHDGLSVIDNIDVNGRLIRRGEGVEDGTKGKEHRDKEKDDHDDHDDDQDEDED